ncbi:MAG: carboxymuconolactone decarboxylase family protein [Phycisphaerales bacterium JB059]
MARITPVDSSNTPEASLPLLEGVKAKIGKVPNLFGTLAHSPAAFGSYLASSEALGKGELGAPLQEQIAVAIAGANACGYCASAHTAIGKMHGVSAEELAKNLDGESGDPRAGAAIRFARAVVVKRGFVSDADLQDVRSAGLSDGEITEIVALVAHNTFTNYFNHVAQTAIDFPEVKVGAPVTA